MSVRDLKAIIDDAGLSYKDCAEKSDLIARAQEAKQRGPKPKGGRDERKSPAEVARSMRPEMPPPRRKKKSNRENGEDEVISVTIGYGFDFCFLFCSIGFALPYICIYDCHTFVFMIAIHLYL